MHRQVIHATPSWRNGPARYDCVFVENGGEEEAGFRGLLVARARMFFSCLHEGRRYSCALVDWFLPIDNEPDDETGLWVVCPEVDHAGEWVQSVISLDSIVRGAHLMPMFGGDFLPCDFHFSESLDSFNAYYVNKYIDHHTHTLAF
ncbi:hypothetical protein HYDPIDRAFT_119445 [Hydnomerulius pinastri MD-312]|uniref:Uncharacterized protein n=1 Tax=Hydnomerulius pinastri MD-312 TaxID=994086 RepID=A0A0C9W6T5_9AGAM|nr:hypothetical protein HYDPIDRAFT_119445 [Hydnomerulius pinastri MD-312]